MSEKIKNEFIILKVERVCKPKELNINGVIYETESYKKALEDFITRKNESPMYAEYINDNYRSFNHVRYETISLENSLGEIIDIDDSYITLKINSNNQIYNMLKKENLLENLKAGMRYVATSLTGTDHEYTCKIDKIITFDVFIMKMEEDKDE